MLILDKYFLKRFLKNFFSCLFAFIFLYVIIDVFSALKDILENHPPVNKIIEYYLYSIPLIFTQITPVAALLSTLFTLSSLNQSNEIIAMRASGLSVYRIIKPLLIFGFCLSLSIFIVNETLVPFSQKTSKFIKRYYIDKAPETLYEQPVENIAVYGFNNRLYFINKLLPKSQIILGLTILEHDNQNNVLSKIYAEKAHWDGRRWVLYQCFIYNMPNERGAAGEPQYFTQTTLKIDETPQDFLRQNIPIENMNVKELAGYIEKLSESGVSRASTRLKVDLYQKFSFPLTSFIIILLGIPSSIVIRRAMAFSSIGLCIGISFIFYVCFAVSIALGKSGAIPPFVAAWMTHLTFGATALYMIKKMP